MKNLHCLIEEGYIRTARHHTEPYTIYNYTSKAQYESYWSPETRMCRGLILSDDGEVVARPFDKFFNWLEGGRVSSGRIVTVTEKIDGSLGILYRVSSGYAIATRGSFDSEQALWATEWLRSCFLPDIPEHLTLLFEIVYPKNRIVVDYGNTRALYLLAARNRFTGEYLPFYPDVYELSQEYCFPIPTVFNFKSVTDIVSAASLLPASREGWVVEFSDGQRFKFKGARYRELHKLISNLSFKKVLEAIAANSYPQVFEALPVEFQNVAQSWKNHVDDKVSQIVADVTEAMKNAPRTTRKEFALYVNKHHKSIAPYMFLAYEDRPYTQLIYRREF